MEGLRWGGSQKVSSVALADRLRERSGDGAAFHDVGGDGAHHGDRGEQNLTYLSPPGVVAHQ